VSDVHVSSDDLESPERMPFRPEKATVLDLDKYDVAAVEHFDGLFRVYKNGSGIKFDNDDIKCVSIPKEREHKDFIGVLFYNSNAYEAALRDYMSFWEWMANKNEARWKTQEKGEMDYDCKNLMHTMRLLIQSEYILQTGEPKIYFEGAERQYLMDIRHGRMKYEEILATAEQRCSELKEKFDKSSLPYSTDAKKINELYQYLMEM
jgi:hypothetical protein